MRTPPRMPLRTDRPGPVGVCRRFIGDAGLAKDGKDMVPEC